LAKYAKLIAKVRQNPREVRFEDACKLAEALGFNAKGGKGSHNSFSRTGEPVGLNFQKRQGGKIPSYQAKQLIAMIDKYADEVEREEDET
jgi:hypothetical protein